MATDTRPDKNPLLDREDAEVVQRGLSALRWRQPTVVVTRLAGGSSGSQVFLLDADGERVVLKATEDPAWHDRAERELMLYRELGTTLAEFLPVLRAAHHDRKSVQLLLTAYDPHPPSVTLTDEIWVALAEQLGRLHSAPVPLSPWLRRRPWPSSNTWPSSPQVTEALDLWAGRGLGPLATRAAAQLAASKDFDNVVSPTLTHGDCHVHNLLRGPEGRTLWADWQEVCLGTGLDDLVFLWQRAEFEGAHPPREDMTAAYAESRSLSAGPAVRAALRACELRLLLLAWPPFLSYGSPRHQETMTQRLRQLVDQGGAVPHERTGQTAIERPGRSRRSAAPHR